MRQSERYILLIGLALAMIACALPANLSAFQQQSEETLEETKEEAVAEVAEELEPTVENTSTPAIIPTETPVEQQPISTPSLTPLPSPTPLDGETVDQPIEVTPLPVTPVEIAADTPPIEGSFDVYLGAPGPDGLQLLRWVDTVTGQKVTEIEIRTDNGYAVRAGQFVYYMAPDTHQPYRVNTAGAVEELTFAAPEPGASFYQFLPSATGHYLAWMNVDVSGQFTINTSWWTGDDAQMVGRGTIHAGTTIGMIRLTNDGHYVFINRHPAEIADSTLFNARYSISQLDTTTGIDLPLVGEPACGGATVCDAHISPDGTSLIRTRNSSFEYPVVVTNLSNSIVTAQFGPYDIPTGAAYEIGYPYFTPVGDIVIIEAYGAPGLEKYLLVWSSLKTSEQRLVVDLGEDKHRPLGWAGGSGTKLLTTREPAVYDTWQIDVETGSMRQIAGMLFLGHIEEPPLTP